MKISYNHLLMQSIEANNSLISERSRAWGGGRHQGYVDETGHNGNDQIMTPKKSI